MDRPRIVVDNSTNSASPRAHQTAICVVTLDNVSEMTSLKGTSIARPMMAEFEERLQAMVRDGESCIPISSTKLCLRVSNLVDRNHAHLAGMKLARLFAEPMFFEGEPVHLDVNAGLACSTDSITDAETLFRWAEAARVRAARSEETFMVASSEEIRSITQAWSVNQTLQSAIDGHEIGLFYQPKIAADDGRCIGCEALVRWINEQGVRYPAEFLPALSKGNMDDLTRHCIQVAAQNLARLPAMERVAVNVPPETIADPQFCMLLLDTLKIWEIEPERITVEILESGLGRQSKALIAGLEKLRGHGIRISIDDFGTGYAALADLVTFPADELKIDRCFIARCLTDKTSQYLTKMMIELGHQMGMVVVGEGVEEESIATFLRDAGCDILQGFWYATPLPAEEYLEWLEAHRAR